MIDIIYYSSHPADCRIRVTDCYVFYIDILSDL